MAPVGIIGCGVPIPAPQLTKTEATMATLFLTGLWLGAGFTAAQGCGRVVAWAGGRVWRWLGRG